MKKSQGTSSKKHTDEPHDDKDNADCTLAYIRVLTRPFLFPPRVHELKDALCSPWDVRMPVDPSFDESTGMHWQEQEHTPLFRDMFDWRQGIRPTATLQPYFSFGVSTGPSALFFEPWQDVANCLKYLLLHQVACHQTSSFISLSSQDIDLFIATCCTFSETDVRNLNISNKYYLLRCHYSKTHLIFGYHDNNTESCSFHSLESLSIKNNANWRLEACIIMKNIARIINVLKDFAIPLTCCPEKRKLVNNGAAVLKTYHSDQIVKGIPSATVTNMIRIYGAIKDVVPHTDQLVSITKETTDDNNETILCQFHPVGRSYLPENTTELLDALVCITEALVELHAQGIMHRDIRWSNVLNCLENGTFTREWILFDFEFAAYSPQAHLAAHTLVVENHAPEMSDTTNEEMLHTTAVDIWGLGYLIQHAYVDVPKSHASDLNELQRDCMQESPSDRPDATACLSRLRTLQARPESSEKSVVKKL